MRIIAVIPCSLHISAEHGLMRTIAVYSLLIAHICGAGFDEDYCCVFLTPYTYMWSGV